MHDIVRTQQHLDVTGVLAAGTTLAAFAGQVAGELADADVDAVVFEHDARQENALADEVGDHVVGRAVVKVVGGIPLRQPPLVQDADLVGDREGFRLVVGDQDRRRALLLQDLPNLLAQALAHLDIEVRERLVEQQQLRTRCKGTGEGHALLLSTGQLVRKAAARVGQADHIEQFGHASGALRRGHATQPEADVAGHGQVREQRIVLEHHADLPLLRGHLPTGPGDFDAVDQDPAGHHRLEAGDAAQDGRLAAAACAEQAADLAARERERQVVEHGDRSVGMADLFEAEDGIHCPEGAVGPA